MVSNNMVSEHYGKTWVRSALQRCGLKSWHPIIHERDSHMCEHVQLLMIDILGRIGVVNPWSLTWLCLHLSKNPSGGSALV